MAYGKNVEIGWVECWNNGYYAVDVYCAYKQDPIANKSRISAVSQQVRSLKSAYSFYNREGVNNGWGFDQTKGGTIVDVNDAVSVPGGGVWHRQPDIEAYIERQHNSDGTPPYTEVMCQFISMTGAPKAPEFDWKATNITSRIHKIDRRAPTITVTETGKTINSISYNISSTHLTTLIQYSLDGAKWNDTNVDIPTSGGGQVAFKLTGLTPNTQYSVRFRCRRDHNEVWSNTVTVNTTTPKPSAPTKGSVSVSNITDTSAKFTISGFSFGSGATWGKYQRRFSFEDWVDIGQSTSFTRTNLVPNQPYTMEVRLVDNYGSASSVASVTFTTNKPSPPLAPSNLIATNVTSNTITLEWDLVENAVNYRLFKDQSLYVETTNSSYTVTDLQPDTIYTFMVNAVDGYGQFSPPSDAITIRTLDDVSKVLVNVDGVAKVGKVFINVNGEIKSAKKIFINVNGQARTVLKG